MTSITPQSESGSTDATVLLIDDNHLNNKLVASILMPQAYNIYIADSGETGVQMARELVPDVILLDIMMPQIDGFQVCRLLQDDPVTRETPIIFITADSSVKTQTKAFQMGGSDFITKPIVDVVLIERIKNQIRLSRNKQQLKTLNSYHELAEELSSTGFWAYSEICGRESTTCSGQLSRILGSDSDGESEGFHPDSITALLQDSKDAITRREYAGKWTLCLAKGGLFDEVCNCRVGKHTKYLRIRAEFCRQNGDRFIGFGAIQDISRIIKTEKELADMKTRLGDFTSKQHLVEANTQLAHELNQPLAAINLNTSYVRQLLDSTPHEMTKIQETLKDISCDIARATNIVRNIRRLIKKEPVAIRKFDLHELLDETVYVFNREVLQKNIELLLTRPEIPCIISSDRTGIQQVIVNLLKNAIEAFGESDTSDPRIEIAVLRNPEGICVLVSDNGPGISEQNREKIFQQYFTSKKDNTGMGLVICRALIKELDGDLQLAKPSEGYNTCFKVTIPG